MAARLTFALIVAALAAGCGGRQEAETVGNDAQRQAEQLAKQAQNLSSQAENGTAAIEQALENEGAIIFENRENLLNQAAGNEAAPAELNAAQPQE
jgi:outer membrane biogenesis lipoprotein LolB